MHFIRVRTYTTPQYELRTKATATFVLKIPQPNQRWFSVAVEFQRLKVAEEFLSFEK